MTSITNTLPEDGDIIKNIMNRLAELLDVEWRILEQAQYDLLPDITLEKTTLEEALHSELGRQRSVKPNAVQSGIIVDFEMVQILRSKLNRNNIRLKAKREACLKRIRAGWAATEGEGSTSYDGQGELRGKAKQKIFNIKM